MEDFTLPPEMQCCAESTLRPLRVISDSPEWEVILQRCSSCKSYWTVRIPKPTREGVTVRPREFELLTESQGTELLFKRLE